MNSHFRKSSKGSNSFKKELFRKKKFVIELEWSSETTAYNR